MTSCNPARLRDRLAPHPTGHALALRLKRVEALRRERVTTPGVVRESEKTA